MQAHDGTYNKHEMIEFVLKCLDGITVSGAQNVNLLSQAFQMLYALQKGVKEEDAAKRKTVDLLKEQLRRATEPQTEPGGDVIGGEHIDLDYKNEVKQDD